MLSLAQTHRGRPQTTSTRLYAGGELQGSPVWLWVKAKHEGALPPPGIVRKDRGFHTQLDEGPESWSPLSGLQGVKPPVEFGERTWDCSPGHAGKDGPHLAMTEGSCGFSRAAAPVWGVS